MNAALLGDGERLGIGVEQLAGVIGRYFHVGGHVVALERGIFHRETVQQRIEGALDFQRRHQRLPADQIGQFLDDDFLAEVLLKQAHRKAQRAHHVLQKGRVALRVIHAVGGGKIGAQHTDQFLVAGGDAQLAGLAQGGHALPGQLPQQDFGLRRGGGIAAQRQGAAQANAPVRGAEFVEANRFAIQRADGIGLAGPIALRRPHHAPNHERKDNDHQKYPPQQAGLDQPVEL